MKIRSAVPVIIVILFTACKKSTVEPNTAPVNTDTPTDIIPKDTSTLLKTSSIYNLGANGTTITDSSLYQWTYDNQRRIVQQTFDGAGYNITFNYTYLSDRYTISSATYSNGSVTSKGEATFFQHLTGQTDSILNTSTGYGAQAGFFSKVITYYYYNQARQDTLQKAFDITTDSPRAVFTLNKYYTGSNLDSSILRDDRGYLNSMTYYTAGNPTATSVFTNNIQTGSLYVTYSDTTSGGLFFVYDASKLQTSSNSITLPSTVSFLETDTYTFDSANRIVSMMRDHHGYGTNEKEVYTWY